jgi:multiple sugar transport system substrate-binding protein
MIEKHLSRRDFLRISALTAAGVALGACGGGEEATEPAAAEATQPAAQATAPPPEEVTLRWLDWSDQDDIVNAAIDTFREKHPNVTINFEAIGDNWGDKQLSQMVAGTAPDVLTGNDGTSYTWAERGQLLDLNPYVEVDLSDAQIDDFFPYQWNGLIHPETGIRMGLPYYPWFYVWYYNKDAFDEAGLDYPGEDWTVEDYSDALDALTQKDADGKVTRWGGMEACQDNAFRFQVWLHLFGANMVDPEDRTHCVLDTEQAQAAFEWHRHRLWDTNTLAQSLQMPEEISSGLAPFATGKVAIMGQGAGDIATLLGSPPGFVWSVSIPPIGPTGKRAGIGTIDNWGIWSGSKSPDMAWAFTMQLALEDDFQLGFSELWGVPPNRKSLLPKFIDSTIAQYPETKPEQLQPQVAYLESDYLAIGEQFARHKESRDIIQAAMGKILVVGDTPASYLVEVAEEVTAANRG